MLSFEKFINFLDKRGYLCSIIYTVNNECVYAEVTCKQNSNIYYIYIPSKYQISVPSRCKYCVSELKFIKDVNIKEDIIQQYGGDQEEQLGTYNKIILDPRYNVSRDIEGILSNQYDNEIKLDKKATYQNNDLKCIVRQISRLKQCFSQIEYKLALVYKKYLCVISRNNEIDCYFVPKINYTHRNLYITFDLEMLYNTTYEDLENDFNKIKKSMYAIFNDNRQNHLRNIMSMFTNQSKIMNTIRVIDHKDHSYSNDLKQHTQLLSQLNHKEKKLYSGVKKMIEEKSNFTQDSKKIRKKNNMMIELKKIINLQNRLIESSTNAYKYKNNLLLEVDNILFDNIVLLDKIHQNFHILNQILEKYA